VDISLTIGKINRGYMTIKDNKSLQNWGVIGTKELHKHSLKLANLNVVEVLPYV
jgi:hypothetical protein